MTGSPDPIGDVLTLPGSQFLAACLDEVEQACSLLRAREETAASRGQAVSLANLRRAALLAAAAEIIAAVKRDGEASAEQSRKPSALIMRAVTVAKQAFLQIDRGHSTEEAA